MTLENLKPKDVAQRIKSGKAQLIDIREPAERAGAFIPGSLSLPLSTIDDTDVLLDTEKTAIFHCKTGIRTGANCDRLAALVPAPAFILDGGLDAWSDAGLPVKKDRSAPMEINRQVQITAGSLVFAGVILGGAVHAGFFALSGFIGLGLLYSGVSGTCGMAKILAAMPWNRRRVATSTL